MPVTLKRKSAARKKNGVKQARRAAAKKSAKKSIADSYDRYKVHEGKQYTGMRA